MDDIEKYYEMYVVPEETIRRCAEDPSLDDVNNFVRLLDKHKIFKDAGLTPVFLTEDMVRITLTTVEKIRHQLH